MQHKERAAGDLLELEASLNSQKSCSSSKKILSPSPYSTPKLKILFTNMSNTEATSLIISRWSKLVSRTHVFSCLEVVTTSPFQTACSCAKSWSQTNRQSTTISSSKRWKGWSMPDTVTLAAKLETDTSLFLDPEKRSVELPIELSFLTPKSMTGWSWARSTKEDTTIPAAISMTDLFSFLAVSRIRIRNTLLPSKGFKFQSLTSVNLGRRLTSKLTKLDRRSLQDKELEWPNFLQMKSLLLVVSTVNFWATTTYFNSAIKDSQLTWRSKKMRDLWSKAPLCSHSKCQLSEISRTDTLTPSTGKTWACSTSMDRSGPITSMWSIKQTSEDAHDVCKTTTAEIENQSWSSFINGQ